MTDILIFRGIGANYIEDEMAVFGSTASVDNAICGIIQAVDESQVGVQYDHFVAQVSAEQLPQFYEEMSARLLELEESVSLVAAIHKSHLDQITPEDLIRMKIDPETFKTRVQYKRIVELDMRHTQLKKKMKGHKLRLSNHWGEEWENKFHGLLPPKPSEGLASMPARPLGRGRQTSDTLGRSSLTPLARAPCQERFLRVLPLTSAAAKPHRIRGPPSVPRRSSQQNAVDALAHPCTCKSGTLQHIKFLAHCLKAAQLTLIGFSHYRVLPLQVLPLQVP